MSKHKTFTFLKKIQKSTTVYQKVLTKFEITPIMLIEKQKKTKIRLLKEPLLLYSLLDA